MRAIQFHYRPLERSSPPSHVFPQIADLFDTGGHVSQLERLRPDVAALQFFPGAWRGYRRARPGANGVHGGVRRAPVVSSGINENLRPAVDLVKFLREGVWIPLHKECADGMSKPGRISHTHKYRGNRPPACATSTHEA